MLARAKRLVLGVNVRTCPDLSAGDLVAHVGMIHRRAAVMVREGRMTEAFLNTIPAWPAAGFNRVDGIPFSLVIGICNRILRYDPGMALAPAEHR